MNNGFCSTCLTISLDLLQSKHGFSHHPQSKILREEALAENGCPFCKLLWESICRSQYQMPNDLDPIQLFMEPPRLEGRPMDRLWVVSAPVSLINPLQFEDIYVGLDFAQGFLQISVNRNDPAADFVKEREVILQPGSDEAIRLVEQWLYDCHSCHIGCPDTTNSVLPTRVIDVGPADGSQEPYLCIPSEHYDVSIAAANSKNLPTGKYIALSYCWGTRPAFTTTSSTLNARKTKIYMDELPLTIRDAVTMTRRLCVRYLWVDAICIIQGSDSEAIADWQRECSRMKDVYGGAYLTIAAAAASNAYAGILLDRASAMLPCVKLPLPLPENPEVLGHVSIRFKQEYHDSLTQPLYSRGWTLQERMLSPRVLICNDDQFAWECQSNKLTESGIAMKKSGSVRLTEQIFRSSSSISEFWHNTVRDFTARALTVGTDKLPAISGLASALNRVTNDSYLAGLWRGSICDDLLWMRGDSLHGDTTPHPHLQTFRAPSWSWASLDGDVRYIPRSSLRNSKPFFTELVDAHVTPVGLDPFGQVLDGWITLYGPLKRINIIYFNEDKSAAELRAITEDSEGEVHIGDPWLDIQKSELSLMGTTEISEELSNLWLLRVSHDLALILTPVDRSGAEGPFRRLGLVALSVDGITWFSLCPKQVIKMI